MPVPSFTPAVDCAPLAVGRLDRSRRLLAVLLIATLVSGTVGCHGINNYPSNEPGHFSVENQFGEPAAPSRTAKNNRAKDESPLFESTIIKRADDDAPPVVKFLPEGDANSSEVSDAGEDPSFADSGEPSLE